MFIIWGVLVLMCATLLVVLFHFVPNVVYTRGILFIIDGVKVNKSCSWRI